MITLISLFCYQVHIKHTCLQSHGSQLFLEVQTHLNFRLAQETMTKREPKFNISTTFQSTGNSQSNLISSGPAQENQSKIPFLKFIEVKAICENIPTMCLMLFHFLSNDCRYQVVTQKRPFWLFILNVLISSQQKYREVALIVVKCHPSLKCSHFASSPVALLSDFPQWKQHSRKSKLGMKISK